MPPKIFRLAMLFLAGCMLLGVTGVLVILSTGGTPQEEPYLDTKLIGRVFVHTSTSNGSQKYPDLPPWVCMEVIEAAITGNMWDPLESTCRHASLSIL